MGLRRARGAALALAASCILGPRPAAAQETFPADVRFGGTFTARTDADLQHDRAGEDIAETRVRLDLEMAARLSPTTSTLISGRLTHQSATPAWDFDGARYGHEVELREARLSWQGPDVSLDVGNLFLRWGTIDSNSPTDVLNPQDLRDPAPVSFEAPLVPIPAARLQAAPGDFTFELDVVPFFEPHRAAMFGTDWAPTSPTAGDPTTGALVGQVGLAFSRAAQEDIQPALLAPQPPDESPRNVSVGTRVGWHGPGVDVHLAATHGWDRIPALTFDPDVLALLDAARRNDLGALAVGYGKVQPRLAAGEPLFTSEYSRLNLIGGDLAWAVGDFVVKAEAAFSFARTLYREDFTPRRTGSLTWAGGVDYMPDEDLAVTVEVWGLRPLDRGPWLYIGQHLFEAVGHAQVTVLKEVLFADLTAEAGLFRHDLTLSPALRWVPADGHALTAGVYVLSGDAGTLGGLYDANDAAFLRYTAGF